MAPLLHLQSASSSLPAAEFESTGHVPLQPATSLRARKPEKVPAGHLEHLSLLQLSLNVPATHGKQPSSAEPLYPALHLHSSRLMLAVGE